MGKSKKFRRLYFDIEVSPNIAFTWNIGYNLNIGHESIIQERAVMCICYKYEGENKIYSLTWDKGNDKQMLIKFAQILNSADECVGHNSDKFDIKWLRTRCLLHGIPMVPDFQSIDTLKLSKKGFRFNSNKLDYITQFLGIGKKNYTAYDLWKDIVLKNNKKAMSEMVEYCKQDVNLLEQLYNKLSPYIIHKSHRAIFEGGSICDCPECSSKRTISNGTRISASGIIKRRLHCMDCGKYFSIAETKYQKLLNEA